MIWFLLTIALVFFFFFWMIVESRAKRSLKKLNKKYDLENSPVVEEVVESLPELPQEVLENVKV